MALSHGQGERQSQAVYTAAALLAKQEQLYKQTAVRFLLGKQMSIDRFATAALGPISRCDGQREGGIHRQYFPQWQ